jgi:hypothetical protein
LAQSVIKIVMGMDEVPDTHEKLKLMKESIQMAGNFKVLCGMVASIQKRESTFEEVVNQAMSVGAANALLQRSFEDWLVLAKAYSSDPNLHYDYEFLSGTGPDQRVNGLETARTLYNAIAAKAKSQ